jgi:hypothetical protein
MNKPYQTASEYIEDIPTLSAKFTAQRAILNAITQAKITDGTYKPKKIICRIPSRAIPIDYHLNIRKADKS